MKRKMILYLLLLPLFQAAAQLPDASLIIKETRDLTLTESLSANVSLIIKEKNGSVRNRMISIKSLSLSDGTEKRLIRFLEPADVKGTSLLIYDYPDAPDEMWIYLPALKRTRRIVSNEKGKSFMSSEFSNSDMSSPSPSDFVNKHLSGSGNNNQWIIESAPVNEDKADEYGYSRKISYIASDTKEIRKMEFYNFDNKLFKVIEVKSVLPGKNGRYIISDMLATNFSNGRSSEIKFSGVQTETAQSEALFTVQNLER